MLGLRRDTLEFFVIGLSSVRIAYSLWSAAGLGQDAIRSQQINSFDFFTLTS